MITIKVDYEGKQLEIKVPVDIDAEEWSYHLRAILAFLTYAPETIDDIFNEHYFKKEE